MPRLGTGARRKTPAVGRPREAHPRAPPSRVATRTRSRARAAPPGAGGRGCAPCCPSRRDAPRAAPARDGATGERENVLVVSEARCEEPRQLMLEHGRTWPRTCLSHTHDIKCKLDTLASAGQNFKSRIEVPLAQAGKYAGVFSRPSRAGERGPHRDARTLSAHAHLEPRLSKFEPPLAAKLSRRTVARSRRTFVSNASGESRARWGTPSTRRTRSWRRLGRGRTGRCTRPGRGARGGSWRSRRRVLRCVSRTRRGERPLALDARRERRRRPRTLFFHRTNS